MTDLSAPARSEPAAVHSGDVASLLRAALALHQAGRLPEAEQTYRRILAAQPKHFDSLHLLGVISSQRGEFAAAVQQMDAAIAVNPGVAVAHNNRGVSLNALGRTEEAAGSFERAVALAPDYVDAWQNRAEALLRLSRLAEAVECYDSMIALRPGVADLFLKRGHAQMALNRIEQAIESYDAAIIHAPDSRDAHLNRGIALARLGRRDEAIESYDAAIALNPNDADALSNRGAALKTRGRYAEALASCDRAIAIDSRLASAFNNRGIVLKEMDRLEEALASYETAIKLAPGFGEALSNRANVLVSLGRFEEAIAGFDRALAANPNDATARCNRGMAKLLLGRFEEGWPDYEARWSTRDMVAGRRDFRQPQWTGKTDVRGKRLLLLAEQGAGDTIMAVRYIRHVAERGATVILEAPPALRSLLNEGGDCNVVTQGDPLPDFDLYCPLMSLPAALHGTSAAIPAEVPYLHAPADHVEKWRRRIPQTRAHKVGINWAGNPDFRNDAARSIGLRRMLPLLACRGVQFFALQKDLRPGDADLLQQHLEVTPLGGEIETFADTAAIISLLDLVISSDTSVVHLAGALGKPVWVLLQDVPDWRWLLRRDDSPWYPTARLFRQSLHNDWTDVIDRVGAELGRMAGRP